jgi:hypothetical protein
MKASGHCWKINGIVIFFHSFLYENAVNISENISKVQIITMIYTLARKLFYMGLGYEQLEWMSLGVWLI